MLIIKDNKIDAVHDSIVHGFFGRQGGVSTGLYDSLNCAINSGDEAQAISTNRALVAKQVNVAAENLVTVRQVHSADCVVVTKPFAEEDRPKADAMVTDRAGVALGVLTADCAPLLFSGLKADGSPVIGAAHSGWGGALKGVGEVTVDKMVTLGAGLETIRAAIGPCIGASSYEVSQGFETPFLERNPEDEHFFRAAQRAGHLMFDMAGYIASHLAQHGVKQVTITGQDTFAEEKNFFSYRRTTHASEPYYGRQISVIVIGV